MAESGGGRPKRASAALVRLRKSAARKMARQVPDLVREAYGHPPSVLVHRPPDDPLRVEAHANARRIVTEQGWLTEEELAALPVAAALALARSRYQAKYAHLLEPGGRGLRGSG